MNSRRIIKWAVTTTMVAILGFVVAPKPAPAQGHVKTELEAKTDKAVQGIMEHLLTKQRLLVDNNIQVRVDTGVVTLKGTVRTLADRRRAEHDAYEVAPGYRIEDELMLATVAVTDQQLVQDVSNSIRKHTFYTVFDWVTLDVSSGVVTLGGWVHQPWLKDVMAKQAFRTPGVKEVKNDIVALPLSFYDDDIRSRTACLIYDDPTFEDHMYDQDPPIHIIVSNGKVILEGIVDNDNEKSIAESIVKIRADIGQVENHLVIQKP